MGGAPVAALQLIKIATDHRRHVIGIPIIGMRSGSSEHSDFPRLITTEEVRGLQEHAAAVFQADRLARREHGLKCRPRRTVQKELEHDPDAGREPRMSALHLPRGQAIEATRQAQLTVQSRRTAPAARRAAPRRWRSTSGAPGCPRRSASTRTHGASRRCQPRHSRRGLGGEGLEPRRDRVIEGLPPGETREAPIGEIEPVEHRAVITAANTNRGSAFFRFRWGRVSRTLSVWDVVRPSPPRSSTSMASMYLRHELEFEGLEFFSTSRDEVTDFQKPRLLPSWVCQRQVG